MKQQQKPSTSKDPLATDKAGQGIAAWTKSLNMCMIVWTRLLERIALRSNGKIIFASNRTDTELLQLLDSIAANNDYTYLEGDWEEFDSSQNNVEHYLFMLNLEKIGCPFELRTLFLEMMKKRYVEARFGSVEVENKKDSGRVDTLIGNSLFNISVLLSCVNHEDIDYALYKGDDSLLVGKNIIMNNNRLAELGVTSGFKLKLATRKSAEFTSFVVNINGASINIPRAAAKVVSRNYTKEKYEEYRIAVKDLVKTTNDTQTASLCCNVNMAHFLINKERVDLLLSFLHMFARGQYRFDSLLEYDARVKIEGL